MIKTIAIAILLLCTFSAAVTLPRQSPVIGIYTLPTSNRTMTYIAASYVKYLEMSGAQVVPLFSNSTKDSLLGLLRQLNGVLFTGGAMDFNISDWWTANTQIIMDFAKGENDNGRVFPVWGTCLGHQLLAYLTSNYDDNVIERVGGEGGVANTLQLIDKNSEVFSNWQGTHLSAATQGKGVLYFNHNWAVMTSYFNNSSLLKGFWRVLATTTSPTTGQQFVSMMQAKNYPFYGVQFHPEKNAFGWTVDINRTRLAVEVTQLLSNNFVEKARQSPNTFSSPFGLYRQLIYNYKCVQPDINDPTQLYYFDER